MEWLRKIIGIGLCLWVAGVFFALSGMGEAAGIPTKVLVRAVSRDAKVIGTHVGGARVTIREVKSGKILAQGMQEGGTGDTMRIMVRPHERNGMVYNTPGTAGFLATLMLERPTVVKISAEGPLGSPQATQRSSKTLLLVPGQNVLGEGIILEIHGFIVSLRSPGANETVQSGRPVDVTAAVHMN